MSGLVGRHLPSLCGRPNQRQPVPQIQRITDQPGCGSVGDAEHTAQFGGGEVTYGWGAFPAEPDWVFGAGQPALGDGFAGV